MLNKDDKKKVIAFDSWTGGENNYRRLVDAMQEQGMELVLVHIGSWGGDEGRPDQEMLGSLNVRDICFYGGGLAKVIDIEKPDAVIYLSVDAFAHRAFNRYCRARSVPTLHLFCGILGVLPVAERSFFKISFASQVRYIACRLEKSLRFVWPSYVRALWETSAGLSEWCRFGVDIVKGALGLQNKVGAADSKASHCCVYVDCDIDYAIKKYGYVRCEVESVGNPDLAHFSVAREDVGVCLEGVCNLRAEVLYIDTGLIFAGTTFIDAKDFIHHLVSTRESLKKQGKTLVVKLHPEHYRTSLPGDLESYGIDVCSNEEFVNRIRNCCAVIVEPSTVSMIPALMGAPLLLAKYGKMQHQNYGDVLTNYPRARLVSDIDEVLKILAEENQSCDEEGVRAWIEKNSGPLPAEQMPHRVAGALKSLV